ncbi:flagellar associated protein [Dunaliella salina]|uniref:Flagellar associated protein n=1 Tax=Dunaliella salina TaxID=3046 RepID=A0ABQ7HAI3_DUNSA|nr:flagellar associated protein [Dunaliella salina]|eukprot:KAF5843865.1 flagellar associated protein [Dunaliella salina]
MTQKRLLALQQPVSEKTTMASRMQATTTEEAKDLIRQFRPTQTRRPEQTVAANSVLPERRKEKENMADFIAKKREIFLLQMSLDTKRAEIQKLEERARQREEALKKSEQMLDEDALQLNALLKENDEKVQEAIKKVDVFTEVLAFLCFLRPQMLDEDALRFDAFLKENDEKVQEAIKKAEMEAKAKQDKVLEIKRLTTAIAALRSEMNKYEEQLEDCRCAKCEDVRKQKELALAAKVKAENDYANARTQQEAERAEKGIKDAIAHLKEVAKSKEPPPPNLDFQISPDEEEIFFNDPAQLLGAYQALEESNLFYIQNAQETEEALEELRGKYRDTRGRMDAEVETLVAQVNALTRNIESVQAKSKRLKERTIENVGALTLSMGSSSVGGAAISLDQLTAKVAEVYVRCGFDADKSIGTLQMLTNLESKLEEYLVAVDAMPTEYAENMEKAREKERRKVARDEKLSAQQREHEARMARALDRASAPVFKKQGKPVMQRSQPLKKKVEVKKDDKADEEAELEAYLARDMI